MNQLKKYICSISLFFLLTFMYAAMLSGCGTAPNNGVSFADRPAQITAQQSDTQASETQQEETEEVSSGLFAVLQLDTEAGMIKVYDYDRDREETYRYSDATAFLNKYGDYTSRANIVPGRIVTIRQSEQTKELTEVQITDAAWEYDDIKRFSIAEDEHRITIADKNYYYDDTLVVYSDETPVKLSDISNKDILRIQGIDRRILSVSITSGHGTISLTNTELFEGGWLSIGTKLYLPVTADMQIEIAEGVYLLSVANDGYGDKTEIVVNRGEETEVDLDTLKGEGPQYCSITFQVDVENAVMTIDGEIIDPTQVQQVRYGIHSLQIAADGYDEWNKKLYVNSKEATVRVAMTEESEELETETETETETSTSQSETAPTNTETETSTSALTDSYLNTLSEIIDTLTSSSSSSD